MKRPADGRGCVVKPDAESLPGGVAARGRTGPRRARRRGEGGSRAGFSPQLCGLEDRTLLSLNFAPLSSVGIGSGPTDVGVADLNGDGKADLITSNYAGTMSVALGHGDGTFGTAVNYQA